MDRPALAIIDPAIPVRAILGVRVHAATMRQALATCMAAVESHRPLLIGVVNAAKVVSMHRQKALREAVDSTDLTLADGMPVVWAGRLLGQSLPERVAGIDL